MLSVANCDDPLALYTVYDKSIIDGVVRALTDMPVYEIGSRDGVIALLSLRDQFVFLGIAMEAFIAGPANHPEMKKALDSLMESTKGTQRKRLLEHGNEILANNARKHLNEIHNKHDALVVAMKMTLTA
jgi:hypothetical protein